MPRLALLLLLLLAAPVEAQDEPIELPPPDRESADARLFRAIYDNESPVFEGVMRGVNGVSLPVFVIAVPVHGLGVLATGESGGPTGRLALSELGAVGGTFLMKTLIRRARPHAALPGVTSRQRRPPGGIDPYSFPSGHSAMAFSIATSLSLSYPEWYVIAPAYTWSSLTALARVWHGMHYPSDIAVGAALGSGVAVLVHVLLAGDGDEELNPETVQPALPLTLTIPLGR